VIITKLQIAPVDLDVSASRVRRVERVELCCLTSSTQPKCMDSTRRTCRVEPSQVEFGLYRAVRCWQRVKCGHQIHADKNPHFTKKRNRSLSSFELVHSRPVTVV